MLISIYSRLLLASFWTLNLPQKVQICLDSRFCIIVLHFKSSLSLPLAYNIYLQRKSSCVSSLPSSALLLSALSQPQPSIPLPQTQRVTTQNLQIAQPPKSPKPSKPPNAHTTPVSPVSKPSPSSNKIINMTAPTVLPMEPVPHTSVLRLPVRS